MKPERIALILIAAVALAGFVVSPALGGPGFLTQKKANKLFLKKTVADGRFLSKDAAAGLLSKSEAEGRYYSRAEVDAKLARPEGEVSVTASPLSWTLGPNLLEEGPSPTATYLSDAVKLSSSAEVTGVVQLSPDLPSTLYGRPTKISGFELCYQAEAKAKIAQVELNVFQQTKGIGTIPDIVQVVGDMTERTDDACRNYSVAAPVALGPTGYALVTVIFGYTAKTPAKLFLGRATFTLRS